MVFDIFHTDETEWHLRKQGPAIAMVANLATTELHAALGIHLVADGDDGIQVVKNNGFVGIWNVHFLHIAFFVGASRGCTSKYQSSYIQSGMLNNRTIQTIRGCTGG